LIIYIGFMDKKLLSLLSLFFLIFVLFIGTRIFSNQLSTFTRAKEETLPSASKSLIVYWPQTIKADGKSSAKIDVFIRNSNEGPISSKKVSLKTSLGDFKENEIITDKNGQVTFFLFSNVEGIAEVQAVLDDGTILQKKISVEFKK